MNETKNEFQISGEPISYWKKILKTDIGFYANLKMYMYNFHEQTNGNPFRKGKITSTFKKWLLEQNIGEILFEEMNKREKKIKVGG